ncbi:MAG: YidC/Oxa1 family membrane protein insertase, partial [Clostridia bacterium]|nr:YidC/Oxa1 family membrane protein insertase [Clostridia bacterium]
DKISTSVEYGDTIAGIKEKIAADATTAGTTLTEEELLQKTQQAAIAQIFIEPAQDDVVSVYNGKVKKNTQFFWIKNVWAVDASYKHPVLAYGDFSQEIITRKSCSCKEGDKTILTISAYTEDGYNNVTGKLGAQKSEPNGYFILIVLSIGTILLQQFVSMRAQKEQNKYSSVDGQSGGQQKMMMIIMTGMFAIFSFMYSSAFSIYLVVSNLFSLFSMLVINKLVDISAERKAAKAAGTGKGNKVLSGRAAAINRNKNDAAENKKENKKK